MTQPNEKPKFYQKIQELMVFWGQFGEHFVTTGAIMPSGPQLARAITAQCGAQRGPSRFLEVGPGTGAFTHALIERLRPGDTLMLVEINAKFAKLLQKRCQKDPLWASKSDQITIVNDGIEHLPPQDLFDAIVCGLPFNNFEPELINTIFESLMSHLTPGGWFSFFEYLAIRTLRAPFTSKKDRTRMKAVAHCMECHLARWKIHDDVVLRNIPPAMVHHLQQPKTECTAEQKEEE